MKELHIHIFMIQKLLIGFFLLLITGCFHDVNDYIIEDGVLIKKKTLWKTILHDAGNPRPFDIVPSFVFNNCIIQTGTQNGTVTMWSVDCSTGKFNWEKKMPFIDIGITHSYQNNGIAVFTIDGKTVVFDIQSGDIIWSIVKNADMQVWVSGIDSLFFIMGKSLDISNPYKINSAWLGNVNTGDIENIYTPSLMPIDSTDIPFNGIGGVQRIVPARNLDDELFLFMNITKSSNVADSSWYSLYNYSLNEWVYKDRVLGSNMETVVGDPEILDQRLFLTTSSNIYCLDLTTGTILWKTSYNDFFGWNGHVIGDRKIIAMIDGRQKMLVCHDIYSGAKLWTLNVGGTISNLQYLNGVVYFASMGDGRLYGVDTENGKLLWRIKSPDNSGLKDECAVIPGSAGEKGKVIVSTFLNGYCYEAER
jgi:outer membrane protein assembly factor BamB